MTSGDEYFNNARGIVTIVSNNNVVVVFEDMFGRRSTLPTPLFVKHFTAVAK